MADKQYIESYVLIWLIFLVFLAFGFFKFYIDTEIAQAETRIDIKLIPLEYNLKLQEKQYCNDSN